MNKKKLASILKKQRVQVVSAWEYLLQERMAHCSPRAYVLIENYNNALEYGRILGFVITCDKLMSTWMFIVYTPI